MFDNLKVMLEETGISVDDLEKIVKTMKFTKYGKIVVNMHRGKITTVEQCVTWKYNQPEKVETETTN